MKLRPTRAGRTHHTVRPRLDAGRRRVCGPPHEQEIPMSMTATTRRATEAAAVRADAMALAAAWSADLLSGPGWPPGIAAELLAEAQRQTARRDAALSALMAAGLPGEVVTVSRGRIVRDTGAELVQAW